MCLCVPVPPSIDVIFAYYVPSFLLARRTGTHNLTGWNSGSGWLLAIPPSYHWFLVTTYHLKLSSLVYCSCLHSRALANHCLAPRGEDGPGSPRCCTYAVPTGDPDIFSDCLLLPVSASCKLRASTVYLAHALTFSHSALLLKALLLLWFSSAHVLDYGFICQSDLTWLPSFRVYKIF